MKKRVIFPLVALFIISITMVLFSLQHNDGDKNTHSQPSFDAFTAFNAEKLDDVIGKSDLVILGVVKQVDVINKHSDEYVIEVVKQYKGATKKQSIYVYEQTGALKLNQWYYLFLSENEIPYYPDMTYRSLDKSAIIAVNGEQLTYNSNLLDKGLSKTELEDLISSSEQLKATNAPTINHPIIEPKRLTIEDRFERADLVAHVKVNRIISESKYVSEMKLDFTTIYKDTVSHILNFEPSNIPYILPGSYEVRDEYLVFLQFYEHMYYTVTKEGSLISKHDVNAWDEALAKLIKY